MADIPRRNDRQRQCEAERLIRDAMAAVEAMGANKRLTDAVTLLDQAFDKVADYTDDQFKRSAAVQSEVDKNTAQ